MAGFEEFEAANSQYVAQFGAKGALPIPPAKKLAVVTCMDARLDPAAHLGIKEGDAHVIRNAGGVSKDTLRSIIISQQLLGTREIALFHHTGCGMLSFSNSDVKTLLKERYPDASDVVDAIDFLPFDNLEESVKADVAFLKKHPLILKETIITGWIYEVETGKIQRIVGP